MKRFALILALALLLSGCVKVPPPADTAPPQTTAPVETTTPPATTAPVAETTLPLETTIPATTPETTPIITDFSQYEDLLSFSAEPNWLARSLGCIYEKPEDVDLYYMFYLGVDYPGSWNEISEESRMKLVNEGFLEEFDLQIMPVETLEDALQDTFGISLSSVEIPESWGYIEAEDAYCSNHSDAFFPDAFTITGITESPDGTVQIHYFCESYYNTSTDEYLSTVDLILTLREINGGYQAVSNVLAGQNEYDSLYDRELIDIISTEEALSDWAASENPGSAEALENLAALSPAFAELMTRSTAKDTFAWYGPERIAALKAEPETLRNAEDLALLIASVRAS